MEKLIFPFMLILGLAACSTTDQAELSIEEQAAVVTKMCSENASVIKHRQKVQSLYSRLGERPGIETFAAKLFASHQANTEIGHFFKNVPEKPFVKNVTDFISVNSGGGGEYTQRDMSTVHKDLGISLGDFLAAGRDVESVLTDLGHGENEIQEVICFLVSLSPTVITR